ncbi:MAG: hypothetical protein ACJAWZ_004005 [Paracoccaceae bacterium]|jgi:hypothetical protein
MAEGGAPADPRSLKRRRSPPRATTLQWPAFRQRLVAAMRCRVILMVCLGRRRRAGDGRDGWEKTSYPLQTFQ